MKSANECNTAHQVIFFHVQNFKNTRIFFAGVVDNTLKLRKCKYSQSKRCEHKKSYAVKRVALSTGY